MTTYKERLEGLIAQEAAPSEIAAAIQTYVRRALTWAFGERLESTGFFQHSFVPDYSLYIGEDQVQFYLRFDPLACLSLFDSQENSSAAKRVVLLLVGADELREAAGYLKKYKDRKKILVTSVECLDYLSDLASRFELRPRAVVDRLIEDIETWFSEARGVIGGPELERFCRAGLMQAEISRTREPELAGSITLGIHSDRGLSLSQALVGLPMFKQATVRELKDGSWTHPFRGQTGWPDLLVTYQAFDSEHALFAVYLDRHLPLGFNSFQEFGRAAAATRLGIPFVMIAPHRGLVERALDQPSVEIASPLIYHAYLRLWDIFESPALLLAWPTDQDGRLLFDGSIDNIPPTDDPVFWQLLRLIESAVQSFGPQFARHLLRNQTVQRVRLNMEGKRLTKGIDYISRPHLRSLEYHRTESLLSDFLAQYGGLQGLSSSSYVRKRSKTVLLSSNSKVLRSDPYLGTLEMFDFAFCRYGPRYEDRRRNLGIRFPRVSLDQANDILMRSPAGPEVRSPRLFFEYCDIVVLEDAVLIRRSQHAFVGYVLDGNVIDIPIM